MRVTVNLTARPKGDPIEVPGLGVVPNGSSKDFDDEAALENWRLFSNREDVPATLDINDTPVEYPTGPADDYDNMTKADLQAMADAKGLEYSSSITKADLITALREVSR
jgi:hypothetical protein